MLICQSTWSDCAQAGPEAGSKLKINRKVLKGFKAIIDSLRAGTSVKINGIIGSKALKRHGFVIDYDLNEVRRKVP